MADKINIIDSFGNEYVYNGYAYEGKVNWNGAECEAVLYPDEESDDTFIVSTLRINEIVLNEKLWGEKLKKFTADELLLRIENNFEKEKILSNLVVREFECSSDGTMYAKILGTWKREKYEIIVKWFDIRNIDIVEIIQT